MTPAEWADAYLTALPDLIRPERFDERFLAAAENAQHNEWAPTQAASVVAANAYAQARNPKLVAIMRLEEVGSRRPRVASRPPHTRRNSSGCIVCPPHVTCPKPVTEAGALPPHMVRERFALLRELHATPDLTEDEREECMRVLITDQRRRLHPV